MTDKDTTKMMRSFFEGIGDLFVNHLFLPYDTFRFMHNWWASNIVNWIFVIIGFVAMVYWLGQLKKFQEEGTERTDISSHSYL